MQIDSNHATYFSGYRLEKHSFSYEDKISTDYIKLCIAIEAAIKNALYLGYRTFLCGMSRGLDLLGAQAVMRIRQEQNNIQLISVLPYKNHSFSDEWGKIHSQVRKSADWEVITSPYDDYTNDCFHLRNCFLIENSTHIICFWDGQNGVTAETLRLAQKNGHSIYNLCW